MSLIRAESLSYKAGGSLILDGICLEVEKGTFTFILGPNGAGKSTLVRLICGLIRPASGGVEIGGVPLGSYHRKKLAALLAYVPQNTPFEISFSVEEYVMTGRYPHQKAFGGVSGEDLSVVEEVLRVTGLEKMRGRDLRTLSGGERQRAVIAAALAQQAQILVLDEPTIFLDPKSAAEIMRLLEKVHQSGITVIMVTHDINQALMFGTGFIGMKHGALCFHERSAAALASEGKLQKLFDIPFLTVNHPEGVQILPFKAEH